VRCAVVLLLALGCGSSVSQHSRPPSQAERGELERVFAVWQEDSRPFGEECPERLRDARVAVVPQRTVDALCYQSQAGACLRNDTIVVTDSVPEENRLWAVRHEGLHLLHLCTHGHGDRNHRAEGLWEMNSGVHSTEYRTRPHG
jgi:hypothetical protein